MRAVKSISILATSFVLTWFFAAITTIQVPPGPSPWYLYPQNWLTIVLILGSPIGAGCFWFRPPAFFAFGCYASLPLAVELFFPFNRLGVYDPSVVDHASWVTFIFCLGIGCLATGLGRAVSRAQIPIRPPSPAKGRPH